MGWVLPPDMAMCEERHFGAHLMRCFSERPANAVAMFRQSALRWPDSEALIDGERRLTYSDLAADVEALAARLYAAGLRPGDRLAILIGNRAEYLVLVLSAWRIGLIVAPMDPRLQRTEIANVLKGCEPVAFAYEETLGDRVGARDHFAGLKLWLPISPERPGRPADSFMLPDSPAPAPAVELCDEDIAAILYTSGTTGAAKGVVIAHLGLVHSIMHFEMCWGLNQADRSLLCISGSNVTGLVAIYGVLLRVGGSVVLLPQFRARDFIDLAARERTTHTFMVPAMYKLCLMAPELEHADLSAWRLGSYGGAIMEPAIIAELQKRLPRLQLMNGYGATELTSPAVIMPAHLTTAFPDSIGYPLPCAEIKVVDEYGAELEAGGQGELWIKGPMVSPGYWRDPALTEREFVDGYWRSGDICSIDETGLVRIHDRLKDCINRAGYKIYSAEVENVLLQSPLVEEVALVALPDPVLGERSHAVVYSRSRDVDEAALRAFCASWLADYKSPDGFTFVDAPLPRNSNGKIVKALVREQLARGFESGA